MRTYPLFSSAFGLALALTISCSSDSNNNSGGGGGVSFGSSSSATTGGSSSSSSVPSLSSAVVSSSSSMPSSSSVASSSSIASSSSSMPSSSSVASSSSNSIQAGIIYGADVSYQGETYKTVKIGTQTWFQRNLNYAVEGSKCGNGSSLSDANTATCNTYGRLYNWATAMKLPSKCNSTLSTSDADCTIRTPHQGICPSGWHIPSYADWEALMTAVGGSSTAGKYLKATNGWNSCGNGSSYSYKCEDKFGFSALPGGIGYSDGYFSNVGNYGYWWSASESYSFSAYTRDMRCLSEIAYYYNYGKGYLFSVRCLQD